MRYGLADARRRWGPGLRTSATTREENKLGVGHEHQEAGHQDGEARSGEEKKCACENIGASCDNRQVGN
jgi:hypothetical protein